jgi:hypothetical protein
MDSFDHAAAQQRRALDFMLDALDLHHARDEAHRGASLLAFEPGAHGLMRAYERLLRRVADLERALVPDNAELEALAREADARAARAPEGGADDI